MSKQELVETMKNERKKWDDFIQVLVEKNIENEVITKNWILKDVVMHIYVYELEIKKAIQTRSLKKHHFWSIAYPQRNKEIYAERDKYTLETVCDLDKKNFQDLVSEVENLQNDEITSQKFFIDSRTTVQGLLKGNSYGHYHEHIAKLKKRFNITI